MSLRAIVMPVVCRSQAPSAIRIASPL